MIDKNPSPNSPTFCVASELFADINLIHELSVGRPIGLLKDGNRISIDAEAGEIKVDLSDEELVACRTVSRSLITGYNVGVTWKYAQTSSSAEKGAVTHPGAAAETHVYADV